MIENVDITGDMQGATSTPEDAAININKAKALGIDPIAYKEAKPAFEAQFQESMKPTQATRVVANEVAKGPEEASLYQQDIDKLSGLEKYVRFVQDTWNGVDITRDKQKLINKKIAQGGTLDETDDFELTKLRVKEENLGGRENFKYDILTAFPATALGVSKNYISGLIENYKVAVGATAIGATTGAGIGAVLGGPAGALAGATSLGVAGAAKGIGYAGAVSTFIDTRADIYDSFEQAKKDDGSPIGLPENEKVAISSGAAALVAAVDFIGDRKVMSMLPGIGKILNPKTASKLVTDPALSGWRKALTKIGKSEILKGSLAEGATEGIQEIIQIIAEETGKSWDKKNEVSILNGLENTWKNRDINIPRVIENAVVGGLMGGTTVGIGKAYEGIKGKPKIPESIAAPVETPITKTDLIGSPNLPPSVQGTLAAQLEIAFNTMSAVTKDTKAYEVSPSSVTELRKQMLTEAGVDYVFVNKDDLTAFAKDQERAEAVRAKLGDAGAREGAIDATIKIEGHKFLELVDDYPEIAGLIRPVPESMSANEFIKKHEEAAKARTTLVGEIPVSEPVSPETEARIKDEEIFNQEDYLNQPTFTEAIASVVPEAEQTKFNEAQKLAREEIVTSIDDAAKHEMNKVIDAVTEIAHVAESEQLANEYAQDPNINIVESFINNRLTFPGRTVEELTAVHYKPGFPVLAIDPRSLDERLQNKFGKDPVLKKRKVFVKGGITVDEAAKILGLPKGEQLLSILAKTPTQQEAINETMKVREEGIKAKVEDSVDLNETAIAKAYNNNTKNHIAEMKFLVSKEWGSVKAGIKRIALPLPKIEELRTKAFAIIETTPLKGLHPNQFKMGERKSQSKAVRAILNNEVEQAFVHKENAALNSELARASHIAIGKVNRDIRFISRLGSERVQEILREAGPKYVNAVNEILDVFNFNPKFKGEAKSGAYLKFAKEMQAKGKGDFGIPDEFVRTLDTRGSIKDLTVEQLSFLADKLRNVYKQAILKNELLGAYKENQVQMTKDFIVNTLHEDAINHPEYDVTKGDNPQGEVDTSRKVGHWISSAESAITSLSYITMELDKGKAGGLWTKMIYHAIKGIGVHEGAWGESAAKKLTTEIKNKYDRYINEYGKAEFDKLAVTKVFVPEFENIPALSNGKLNKIDLLVMLTHWGTVENRERLTNFGLDEETIFNVLERELSIKDFDFVQKAVWNVHRSFIPRIIKLEQLTEGTTPDLVPNAPFEAHGITYQGGYMPLKYVSDIDATAIRNDTKNKIDSAMGLEDTKFTPSYAAQGMTKRNYLKDREGSKKHINLDVSTIALGLEEVVYDLTMRVPVRDTLDLITDPQVAKDIISIVGPEKYKVMTNTVMEATRSAFADKLKVFGDNQRFLNNMINGLEANFAVTQIAANIVSLSIQPLSMFTAIERMGVANGSKHISLAILKAFSPNNWHLRSEFIKLAEEINPEIAAYKEGIDDFVSSSINKVMPQKRLFATPGYNSIKNMQSMVNDLFMHKILGTPDLMQKYAVALGAYSQFMAGDAPGYSADYVYKLSAEVRHEEAKAYAQHVSTTTLTTGSKVDKAAAQKLQVFQLFTRFWNDARNQLNNALQVNRNIKLELKKAISYSKEGNTSKAIEHFNDAGTSILTVFMLTATATLFQKMIRGEASPFDDDKKKPEDFLEYYAMSPSTIFEDRFGQNIPIIRDMIFAAKSKDTTFSGRMQSVSIPIMRVFTDMVVGTSALIDALNVFTVSGELTEKQMKAILSSGAYVSGGAPVNAGFKALKYSEEIGNAGLAVAGGTVGLFGLLKQSIDAFLEKFDKSKETKTPDIDAEIDIEFEKIREEVRKSQHEQALQDIKDIKNTLSPEETEVLYDSTGRHVVDISNEGYEILKNFESTNNPKARNDVSGATGLYQFVTDTWNDVAKQIGLPKVTDFNKGTKKDPRFNAVYQEKAVRFLTQSNIKSLNRLNERLADPIPVNLSTIYALHLLGATRFRRIFANKEDHDNIQRWLSPVVKGNKGLMMRQVSDNGTKTLVPIETLGEFKAKLNEAMDKGRRLRSKTKNTDEALTLTNPN